MSYPIEIIATSEILFPNYTELLNLIKNKDKNAEKLLRKLLNEKKEKYHRLEVEIEKIFQFYLKIRLLNKKELNVEFRGEVLRNLKNHKDERY